MPWSAGAQLSAGRRPLGPQSPADTSLTRPESREGDSGERIRRRRARGAAKVDASERIGRRPRPRPRLRSCPSACAATLCGEEGGEREGGDELRRRHQPESCETTRRAADSLQQRTARSPGLDDPPVASNMSEGFSSGRRRSTADRIHNKRVVALCAPLARWLRRSSLRRLLLFFLLHATLPAKQRRCISGSAPGLVPARRWQRVVRSRARPASLCGEHTPSRRISPKPRQPPSPRAPRFACRAPRSPSAPPPFASSPAVREKRDP